jgi:Holliday junction resolvase
MNEKLIERKLREAIRAKGGIAIKLASPYFRGLPDRLVLLPGGAVYFVELKSTGEKPSRIQRAVMDRLRALGFDVQVIDGAESLEAWKVEKLGAGNGLGTLGAAGTGGTGL